MVVLGCFNYPNVLVALSVTVLIKISNKRTVLTW
jgi:hypothetical protein